MPYLGVTLPAALTHPCNSWHGHCPLPYSLLLSSPDPPDPSVLELALRRVRPEASLDHDCLLPEARSFARIFLDYLDSPSGS
ncbi:hypothetical protein KPH14_006712 [Odynerus spinipes]|uniref:Uncharacterized protein n=1 Tax=Odynerus spinipes TaxID=1348599 RepID=A0AAD9RR63_9HYME|nr:hypothetical protein KPH14_006712 [Odynerus spinipes]